MFSKSWKYKLRIALTLLVLFFCKMRIVFKLLSDVGLEAYRHRPEKICDSIKQYTFSLSVSSFYLGQILFS